MKTINESPYEFFQQGGWSFLGGAAGGEDVSLSTEILPMLMLTPLNRASLRVLTPNPSSKPTRKTLWKWRAAMKPVTMVVPEVAPMRVAHSMEAQVMMASLSISFACSNVYQTFKGDDWDELERKAAKCERDILYLR
jgi:hypothetical protein